jgi:hypothetical protein
MTGVLALSSSALTDRMMVHTDFLRILASEADVRIWAMSQRNGRFRDMWQSVPVPVDPFPEFSPLPEFPHNYLRRLNSYAWDFRLRDPSRVSMRKHIRDTSQRAYVRMLRWPGRLVAATGLHERLERHIEGMMIAFERSPEASRRLLDMRPDIVLSTGTFRYEEPAVVAAAKRLGIPVLALITSWDNISIKERTVLSYDGYIVWSPRMKQELLQAYAESRRAPVYVVGAPQFDVFRQTHRYWSREEFCRRLGLDAARPVILHALGVANGVDESYGALDLARRLRAGELGNAQLIVRPHPVNNHDDLRMKFAGFGPDVVLQQHGNPALARSLRSQDDDEITEWVNTFLHSDVVVHLSSSVAIDAALFDRPSVCMDYDPMPGGRLQELVKEVNHVWTHYKPVAESGGTWLAASPEEVVRAIRAYLENPALHREERRRMAEYVCGYTDGRCGVRLAEAVLDFLSVATRGQAKARALTEAC